MAVPSAPTGLYAMPSKLSVALFWDMPSEAVTGYQVYYDVDTGWVDLDEALKVVHVIRDLDMGTTYQFSLRAVNDDGVSPYVTVSGTPEVTPGAGAVGQTSHEVTYDGGSFDNSTSSSLQETFTPFISANQFDVGNLIVMFMYVTGRESGWSANDNIDTPSGWTRITTRQEGSNEFIWQGCYARFWASGADNTPTFTTSPAEGLDWNCNYSWWLNVDNSGSVTGSATDHRRDYASDGDAPFETTSLNATRGGSSYLWSALWDDQEVLRSSLDDGQKSDQTEIVQGERAPRTGTHNGMQPITFRSSSPMEFAGAGETAVFVRPGDENEEIITFTINMYPTANPNSDLAGILVRPSATGTNLLNYQTTDDSDLALDAQSITVTKSVSNIYIWLKGGDGSRPTVTVNGTAANIGADASFSDTISGPYSVALGSNTYNIQVTAEDGTDRDLFVLTVYRQGNTGVGLDSFTTTANNLSPNFNNVVNAYTADVGVNTSSFTITAELSSSQTPVATITINGVEYDSEEESAAIAIANGERKTVSVVIQPEEPLITRTIVLSVTRPGDTNANLTDLEVDSGSLAPDFVPGTTAYTITYPATTANVKFTPTTDQASATLTLDGTTITSGTEYTRAIAVGATTTFTFVVTAGDGTTTKTYTVAVTRTAQSTDDTLSSAEILLNSSGTDDQPYTFDPDTLTHNVTIPNSASGFRLRPTANNSFYSVINFQIGNTLSNVPSGTIGPFVSLASGQTKQVKIIIVAENTGHSSIYTWNVTRASSGDATLSALSTSVGSLSPVFLSTRTIYTVDVGFQISSITITPTANQGNATITVNGDDLDSGSASDALALSAGVNSLFTIVVTSQDGNTTNTVLVGIVVAPSPNATLQTLTTSAGALQPTFAPLKNNYTLSLLNANSSITMTPTLGDPNASMTLFGFAASDGVAVTINLPTPGAVVNLAWVVTAQDGTTTNTYRVAVTREEALSTNAMLSGLDMNSEVLVPVFSPTMLAYRATLPASTAATFVTVTTAQEDATVEVNGAAVSDIGESNLVFLTLNAYTLITIVVTAEDGTTTLAYTIDVLRGNLPKIPLARALNRPLVSAPNRDLEGFKGAVMGSLSAPQQSMASRAVSWVGGLFKRK